MQKTLFILLNLIISSNLPTWVVLNWYKFFKIEDSIDIMAYTGLEYIVFTVFYAIFKIELFSILKKHSKTFQYTSIILERLKSNTQFQNKLLISIFFIDLLFFVLTFFVFKTIAWETKGLALFYVFSGGGVFICYLSYLIDPWVKSRFNEK